MIPILPPVIRLYPLLLLGAATLVLASCTPGETTGDAEPGTDEAASNPMSTAADGELTVGDLIASVDETWPGVTSMRMTSMSGAVPTDSDTTPIAKGTVAIEEWTAPNSRRIIEQVDGVTINEQVFVDGQVYMWGMFVGTSVAPEVGPTTWVTLDPSIIPPDTPVGYRVSYLARAAGPPFGMVSEQMHERPVTESGTVQVGGRACTLYRFVDTTQLGERIEYELALDENNLPCQLVQRAGGFQNSTVYEINDPDLAIVAPDAPLPVSGTPEG